ncbi:HEAT repeat domain-containing protein [Paenibacillus sp. 19GGS1-52]|uniref:HEAT repeat domain-containing protein n=1 Tax=Paenibacillus sp. 19GGS1-52 TaxID=2758563 RepID=UPI001EFA8347|nr:HEAT repeat domain-containing protein [Paenibacillus sp. 19GGS1-52]ULO08537.1 HEAT repeat domain-containing protein [Paenibacillus sp. 19GGS1-52]
MKKFMSFLNIISVTEGKDRYIRNLINRMSTVDNAKSSGESISFKAHREAESLSDKDLIPILVDHISNSSSQGLKSFRNAAYFILSKLLQKHENLEALQFLINQLKLEIDKYVISSMLDRISELNKTESIELAPIFQFVQHQDWTIRHSAIRALKKSRDPQARKVILEIILRSKGDFRKNKEDIIYSVSTLSDIGTIEDLELLEELSINKIRDIRDSSTYAIETINKRQ